MIPKLFLFLNYLIRKYFTFFIFCTFAGVVFQFLSWNPEDPLVFLFALPAFKVRAQTTQKALHHLYLKTVMNFDLSLFTECPSEDAAVSVKVP